jgi:hypothetical protein
LSKSESFARHQASVEHISVGKPLARDAEPIRDAIHISVISVFAGETMQPGTPVFVTGKGEYAWPGVWGRSDIVGLVDPFLQKPIKKGDRFVLFVLPGTITGLRHVWTHPEFPEAQESYGSWGGDAPTPQPEPQPVSRTVFQTADYEDDDYSPCAC